MTAYRAVVAYVMRDSGPRERECPHQHRSELAAFECACRQIRRQLGRSLHGDPRVGVRFFAQFSAFTREVSR